MTHISSRDARHPEPAQQETPPFDWLPDLMAFLHRRWRGMAGILGVFGALALLYCLSVTPRYTAELELLIDIARTDQLRQQTTPHDALTLNSMLESQVQVLQSAGLARQTAERLGLGDKSKFVTTRSSMIETVRAQLLSLFAIDGMPAVPAGPIDVAAQTLLKMMRIRRIGQTYVIGVAVTSTSPVEAAWLANGVANTYLTEELRAKEDGIQQATGWLQVRINELNNQALTADRAVQDFKAAHKIVDTEKGLMGSQQLTELSSQLGTARASIATAQARLQRIESVIHDGVADAGVTDSLDNKVIVTLRQQIDDDQRRVADLAAKYGNDHVAVRGLRNEMTELRKSIQGELARIAETYKSDYEVARSNEASLRQRLDEMVTDSARTNNDLVVLRSLQSSADTFRTLYQNFLQRYTQAVQDQSFPVPEARVITAAVAPDRKSHPKTTIILAFALVAGSGVGFAIAIAREALDRGIRDPGQLRAMTGLECLGLVPRVRSRLLRRAARAMRDRIAGGAPEGGRLSLSRYVISHPRSAFSDAIRALRMRIIYRQPAVRETRVIGCVPDVAGAGASTIAGNLAHALALTGDRTILLDWDFIAAKTSRELIGGRSTGCLDVLAERLTLHDCIRRDRQTELDLLPAGYADAASLPRMLAMSEPMLELLVRLRAMYRYVIVDLPPLTTVSETHYAAHLLDAIVVVSEWGKLPAATLSEQLDRIGLDPGKIVGVVLNKVTGDDVG